MSRAIILSPTQDLIARVAALLEPDGNGYDGCRIVFPGRRPSHFLRKALAEKMGKSFLPPVIQTIDDFAEFIARKHLPGNVRQASELDGVRLLYDLHRSMSPRLGGEHFVALDRFLPLGSRLFKELEELVLSLAPASKVRGATSMISSGDLHRVADLAEGLTKELVSRHLTTRARLYVNAAENFEPGDLADSRMTIFAGFYGLTPAEQMLVSKVSRLDTAIFLFVDGPGLARRLEQAGISAEKEGGDQGSPDISLTSAPDAHGQVFAVAADLLAARNAGQIPDEHTVIVVPRPETLFPLLHHALSQLPEDSFNISLGFPVERTPLAGLFRALHDLASGERSGSVSATAYLNVLLHPYVKNFKFGRRTDITRILVHAVEDHLAGQSGRARVTFDEIELSGELFLKASVRMPEEEGLEPKELQAFLKEVHDIFFRSLREPANVGAFASRCAALVRAIHDRTTAAQHPTFRQFADTFLETMRELEHSLLADLAFERDEQYLDLLRQILAGRTVPFPGSPLHGLQVLGLLETRGLRFDTVTILDANDDVIPGRGGAEALLPQKVRTDLKMETNRNREEIMEYYLTVLIRGARKVRILSVEGGANERSRVVERLVWERERSARKLNAGLQADAVRYAVSLATGGPGPITKAPTALNALKKRSYSATSLNSYLGCGIRFHHQYVLGLRDRDEVSDDIEAPELGLFVHEVLQKVFAPFVGRLIDPSALNGEAVAAMTMEDFSLRFGGAEDAARELLRERTAAQVAAFIEKVQIPIAMSAKVKILGLEVPIEFPVGKYTCSVRLDRLEERVDGTGVLRLHVLDYKTGSKVAGLRVRFDRLNPEDRSTWNDAIGSLQLAMYTLAVAHAEKKKPEDIEASFMFLGSQSVDPDIEVGLFRERETDRATHLKGLRTVIEGLIKEINDPATPFNPPDDLEKTCPRCPFTTICGTTWTVRRSAD